jgi:hypothetical protein
MYIAQKLRMLARNLTLMRRHERAGGVADFANCTKVPGSIGFDFSNARHVHIGDHLFLEPTVRACRDRGIPVVVAPMAPMREYFQAAGYELVTPQDARAQDLRISSVYMYDDMPRAERHVRFLYLNTIDHHITGRVAEHLAEHVVRAACLDPSTPQIGGRPWLVPNGPTPLDDVDARESGPPWWVFNDTVDSGWFRVLPSDRAALAAAAAEKRRAGFRIVRVGTEAERIARPGSVGLDELDLRGRTSVMDLFRLLRSPRVEGTISFDHAVAHMGIALGKPAVVRLRRMSPPHARFMKRHLIPSFTPDRTPDIQFI